MAISAAIARKAGPAGPNRRLLESRGLWVALGVLFALAAVWCLVAWSSARRWQDLAERRQAELASVRSLAVKIEPWVKSRAEAAMQAQSSAGPLSMTFLQTMAQRAEVPAASLSGMNPEPPRIEGTGYEESRVAVQLRSVRLARLVTFLYSIRHEKPDIRLVELRLKPDRGRVDSWNATVVVALPKPTRWESRPK